MFAPNTIQSRLHSREEDDQNSLLNEVNQTLLNLQKWKEEQRRLDEDLEKQLAAKKINQKVEVDEETCTETEYIEPNMDLFKYKQATLVDVKKLDHQELISFPEPKSIENYSLYKKGDELNEVLTEWNSELDKLNLIPAKGEKVASEWRQVDEIEKELAELEELMEGVDLEGED